MVRTAYYRETVNIRMKEGVMQILVCDRALLCTVHEYTAVAIAPIKVGFKIEIHDSKKNGYKFGAWVAANKEDEALTYYYFNYVIPIKKGSMPTMADIRSLLVEHLI